MGSIRANVRYGSTADAKQRSVMGLVGMRAPDD